MKLPAGLIAAAVVLLWRRQLTFEKQIKVEAERLVRETNEHFKGLNRWANAVTRELGDR